MMAKKYFLILVIAIVCYDGSAQKKRLPPIRRILKQAIGPSMLLTTYPTSYPTNSLISQYAKSSLTFQVISIQQYFGNWGFEGNLAIKFNQDASDDHFRQAVVKQHPDEKFSYGNVGSSVDVVSSVGPVYKKELGRFVVIAKGLIGVATSSADSVGAVLLSADRNTFHEESWTPSRQFSHKFIFNPGVSVMYRINRVLGFSIEVSYWQMANHLTYSERTSDASDDRLISQKQYFYTSPIRQINVGLGLNFTL